MIEQELSFDTPLDFAETTRHEYFTNTREYEYSRVKRVLVTRE